VLEATTAAVNACVVRNSIADVAAAAREVILASPFGDGLGASMGHGIGLETVELPYVMASEEMSLEAGMSLCIEPGLFFPGWAGAAIEQEVIIRPDGPPEIITADIPMRMW